MDNIKYILQQPDGSQSEYDVQKFSDDGKDNFVLLGEVQELYRKLNTWSMVLKKAELKIIDELGDEFVENNLLESEHGKDSDSKQ